MAEQQLSPHLFEKRKQFLKIYDTEMRRELHTPTLLTTLETLSKVLNNIINNPEQEKYRKIPVTSKTFQETVIDKKGGRTFILACGFVRRTVDGKEYWMLPSTSGDVDILKLACSEVVDKRRNEINEQNELEKRRDELEKMENAKRAEKVRKDFMEDRQTWSEKVEMTGGVKDSVALDFVDRSERIQKMTGNHPPGLGGGVPPPGFMGQGGVGPTPGQGQGQGQGQGGHVLGGDDDEDE